MKIEIDIPDLMAEKLGELSHRDHLTLEQAASSLVIFQACASGIMFRSRYWGEPFAFETIVLPWGVRITMNREVTLKEVEHAG